MLQQTTVTAVRGRYRGFLERFPDVSALARASEENVLAAWSGLGYYARARHLHRAARAIVRDHGARLPRDPALLRALPGFGEYTSAAVASLAFGLRVPAADANVTRVLSRLFAIEGLAGTRAHVAAVRRRAAALLPRTRPGDLTAALMDLGQLICTPRRPACGACPVSSACVARAADAVERYPRRRPKPATRRVFAAAACTVSRGRTLLVRLPGALLSGLWRFPLAQGRSAGAALRGLRGEAARLSLRLEGLEPLSVTQHTMVHRRLDIRVYRAVPLDDAARPRPSSRWFSPRELESAAIPTLTRKIARAARFLPAA